METKGTLPGPGRFQWDRGSWFSSQLGCTAWMFAGAVVLVPHAPGVAALWLACFAVANAIGSWFWWRRDRLRPYPALQALMLACGANGFLALVALHLLRPGLRITRPLGISLADEPRVILGLLGLVIALMGWFHLLEHGARKEKSRSEGPTLP